MSSFEKYESMSESNFNSNNKSKVNSTKILKLLLTPRKRRREEDKGKEEKNDDENTGNAKKKPRRSTRVRFQPLKYWANESIITDPKHKLTMKDIEEKGDSLLLSSKDELYSNKSTKRKKRKKINDNNNNNNNNNNNEYKCDEWKEYQNDKYYLSDNFDGNAWVRDNESCDDEQIRKLLIVIPSKVNMNKTGDIYGGSIIKENTWKSGFVEIPPKCILNRDEAAQTVLFFVHFAQNNKLKFTLFTQQTANNDQQKKTFYLSQGSQFYVPVGHEYELKNLSKTHKVHLTVTQFIQ